MNTLSDILKSSIPTYELQLPSTGKTVSFRPFLVKEEKVLLIAQQSDDYDEILRAIKNIIESCFENIKNAGDLPLFDIEYLFINLRAKSVGETVSPLFVCPHTGENIKLDINLLDVTIDNKKEHDNKIKIKDDIILTMKYPSVNIVSASEEDEERTSGSDYFYDLASKCIEKIETKEEIIDVSSVSKKEVSDFVDNLSNGQFEKIMTFFSTSPKLHLKVEYKTSDGEKREVTFSNLTDFFV